MTTDDCAPPRVLTSAGCDYVSVRPGATSGGASTEVAVPMPASGVCPPGRHEVQDTSRPVCWIGAPAASPSPGVSEQARNPMTGQVLPTMPPGILEQERACAAQGRDLSTTGACVAKPPPITASSGPHLGLLACLALAGLLVAVLAYAVVVTARRDGRAGKHATAVRTGAVLLAGRAGRWAAGECREVKGRRKREHLKLRWLAVRWALVAVLPLLALGRALAVSRALAVLLTLAALCLCWLKGGMGKAATAEDPAEWWGVRLDRALVTSKAVTLPKRKEGEPRPAVLQRLGPPQHGEHETTVKVRLLLPGATVGSVQAKRTELAAALDVPAARLEIRPHPDESPSVVTFALTTVVDVAARVPAVVSAGRTDWTRPVVIGRDARGREVSYRTDDTHTVLAGGTGSGKTALARLVVAHAALDPRVRIFGLDGKGDAGSKGWAPLEHRCEAFVRGMGPNSPAQVEALLTEVTALAEQRGRDGQDAPEVVLILEEWATARAVLRRLDPKAADRCDALVTVLLATARSRGVHCIVIVQRGTDTALTTDQRANCLQRLVGKFADSKETRYVLEAVPPVLPARAGEFAVSLDGSPAVLVTVDHLEPAAWKALCARLPAARPSSPAPVQQAVQQAPSPRHEAVPPVVMVKAEPVQPDVLTEPLLADVLAVLADVAPHGLGAAALLERLPAEPWRPATAEALGLALRRWPEHVGKVPGRNRAWGLADPARPGATTRRDPAQTRRAPVGDPS